MEVKILAPGEKLKIVRKELDLLQEEVAGNDVTRNFISMIENGKLKLNQRTARILYQNLLTAAKRKGKDLKISFEELFQDEYFQVCRVLDNYNQILHQRLNENSDDFTKVLDEVERFIFDWDIKEKKLLIYGVAGDYYSQIGEFNRSVDYYLKALECVGKKEYSTEFLDLTLRLARSHIKLKRYEDSIHYMNQLMIYEKDIPKEKLLSLIFNRSLSNKNLEKYDKALDDLDKLISLLDNTNTDKLFDVLTLKANCYIQLNRLNQALNIYHSILGKALQSNNEHYIITLLNIVKIYELLDKRPEVLQYLNISLEYLDAVSVNSSYITKIHMEIAAALAYLNRYMEGGVAKLFVKAVCDTLFYFGVNKKS